MHCSTRAFTTSRPTATHIYLSPDTIRGSTALLPLKLVLLQPKQRFCRGAAGYQAHDPLETQDVQRPAARSGHQQGDEGIQDLDQLERNRLSNAAGLVVPDSGAD